MSITKEAVESLVDVFVKGGLNLLIEAKDKNYLAFADRLAGLGLSVTLLSNNVLMRNGMNCVSDLSSVPDDDILVIDKGIDSELLRQALYRNRNQHILFTDRGNAELFEHICSWDSTLDSDEVQSLISELFSYTVVLANGTVVVVLDSYVDDYFEYIVKYMPEDEVYVCADTLSYFDFIKLRNVTEFQKVFNDIWFS